MPPSLTVTDYSEDFFTGPDGGVVPPRRGGKVVVIEGGGGRHMVFAPRGLARNHSNIVEQFLLSRGVLEHTGGQLDDFHCSSAEWRVLGGAHWEVDEEAGGLRLWGLSQQYGELDLHGLVGELRLSAAFGWARVSVG